MSNIEHIGFNPNDYAYQGNHRAPDAAVYGGTVRVSINSDRTQRAIDEANARAAQGHEAGPLTRVHGETVRAVGGQIIESSDVARHVHSVDGKAGQSILTTIQRQGSKSSIELVAGDPSSRTSIDAAVRVGAIVHNKQTGQYELPGRSAPTAEQVHKQASDELAAANTPQAPEADPLNTSFIDQSEEALWAEDLAPLSQPGFDRAQASMANVVAHGNGTMEDVARGLAINEGMDPERALDYVQQGYAKGEREVARAVSDLIPADQLQEFYEAVRMQPAVLQDAIQTLLHERSASKFRALAKSFAASRVGQK